MRKIQGNFQIDVSNYEEIVALKEKIKADLGEVDILVNNAGLLPKVSLLQGNPEDILRIIKVNMVANFWVRFFVVIFAYIFRKCEEKTNVNPFDRRFEHFYQT